MTKKDIAQLKRAFGKDEEGPIIRVASCYVDVTRDEIKFQPSMLFSRTDEDEAEQFRMFLKKGITGKVGSTTLELEPKENALKNLLETRLKDEDGIYEICGKIREAYQSEENYGIFLVYGAYDIPVKAGDGEVIDSDEVYEFVLVMIQPCLLSKAGIVYDLANNNYRDRKKDRPLSAPIHSFLYPSFDEGHSDVSKAVYFSKNEKIQEEVHEVLNVIFGTDIPMTAQEQKTCFSEMMGAGFNYNIPYDAIQRVYEKFSEIRAENESNGLDAKLTTKDLTDIITDIGKADPDSEDALQEVAEGYTGRFFNLDNIAPGNVNINTDLASVKVDLNEITGLDVIEYKGRRCLVLPLSEATVENIAVH